MAKQDDTSSAERQSTRDGGQRALRWGVLGTGAIARQFAEALAHSRSGTLAAVASRAPLPSVIVSFAGATVHVGYQALLNDPTVDAVYIATPHPMHAEWAIRAAEAGKHILCEKPIGMNAAEAMAIIDAARRNGVFLMEAFMYRAHPQTQHLVDIIGSGKIGDIRLVQASYGYNKAYDAAARHFDNALGGGGILDIGGYCVSLARLVAGVAAGKPFEDPHEVLGKACFAPTGVDTLATALLTFPSGIVAQLSCSITLMQDNVVRIFGSKGRIEVRSPWFCSGRQGGRSVIFVQLDSGESEEVSIETDAWLYAIEADVFAASARAGQAQWPAMSPADTFGNMRTLDRWRQAVGLEYDLEKPRGLTMPLAGRPLAKGPDAPMPYSPVQQLAKPVSRLVMGCRSIPTLPEASVLHDTFFEQGGTTFDTAHIYAGGRADILLGQWIASRGIREQIVVLGKGAHTPNCRPEAIVPELEQSLERLRTDYLDIYCLHRDDPDIPVGEFVDVLDELRQAGRIRIFGGSNWTRQRVDDANAYAARTGKQGFHVLSNHFSLAEMVEPMWAGCIASSDPESIDWLKQREIALFSWSSQAQGFFTDRAGPDKRDNPDMVRCWYSETNFGRRGRAQELAERHGATMNRVALAYALNQEFSNFPIIGPLTLDELHDSLGAVRVPLTTEEIDWLRTGG